MNHALLAQNELMELVENFMKQEKFITTQLAEVKKFTSTNAKIIKLEFIIKSLIFQDYKTETKIDEKLVEQRRKQLCLEKYFIIKFKIEDAKKKLNYQEIALKALKYPDSLKEKKKYMKSFLKAFLNPQSYVNMEVIRENIKCKMAMEKIIQILKQTIKAVRIDREEFYSSSLRDLTEFNIKTYIPGKKEFEEQLGDLTNEISKRNSRLKEISKENQKFTKFFDCVSKSVNALLNEIDKNKNDKKLLALIDKIECKFSDLLANSSITYTSSEDSSETSSDNNVSLNSTIQFDEESMYRAKTSESSETDVNENEIEEENQQFFLKTEKLFRAHENVFQNLTNFGNTCFVNSIVQAIFHLKPIYNYINEHNFKGKFQHMKNLLTGMTSNFDDLNEKTKSFLEAFPMKTESLSRWGYTDQHDCCEYFEDMLNQVNAEIWRQENESEIYDEMKHFNQSSFNQIFNIEVKEQINCYRNHLNTLINDNCLIQIGIPNKNNYSLNSLIKAEFTKNKTDGNCNELYGDQVCRKTSWCQRMFIKDPEILSIQLKRFALKGGYTVCYKKPVEIDRFVDGIPGLFSKYQLTSVVCHIGDSLENGHYITYCEEYDKNWYLFDDSKNLIEFVDLSNNSTDAYYELTKNSYLLFYTKIYNNAIPSLVKQISELKVSQDSVNIHSINDPNQVDDERFHLETLDKDIQDDMQEDHKSCHLEILVEENEEDLEADGDDNLSEEDYELEQDQDLQGPENYVNIDGQKIYFNYSVDEESVSGLLSINNILCRKIYFEEDLHEAKEIWTDFNDLELVLNSNGKCLQKMDLKSTDNDKNANVFIVDQEKHYYVLNRFFENGPLFLLDPIKSKPTLCESDFWGKCKRRLNKYKDRDAISVFKVVESNSSIIINKINPENLIYKLFNDKDVNDVHNQLRPYIIAWKSYQKTLSKQEEIFLFELINENPIESINIKCNIFKKIIAFISLKKRYSGFDNIKILETLKHNLEVFNERDANEDFTSKNGIPYTEAEDKFIMKLYNDCLNPVVARRTYGIPIKNWNTFKGLEGRSINSVKLRLQFLVANDFKVEYKKFEISKNKDAFSKFGRKNWSKKELAELERQIDLPASKIDIPGRSLNAINHKKGRIYIPDINKISAPIQTCKAKLMNVNERVNFLKSSKFLNLTYIGAFNCIVHENFVSKINEKTSYLLKCGTIFDIQLHYDQTNIIIFFNNIRNIYITRENIVSIILSTFKGFIRTESLLAIVIKQKNINFNIVHLLIYEVDILDFFNQYRDLLNKKVEVKELNYNDDMEKFEKYIDEFRTLKKENMRNFFHLTRKLLNIVDADDFNTILFNLHELHKEYYQNEIYLECLRNVDTPYLSESTIEELHKDKRMDFLFESTTSNAWSLSFEYVEFNNRFFESDIKIESKRILEAFEVTNTSDMYQFDHVEGLRNDYKLNWALGAYEMFIEDKNEELENQNPKNFKKVEPFPLTEEILQDLILYWTRIYAVNTIRTLISLLHQKHKIITNTKFSTEIWKILEKSLSSAQKQRDQLCINENRRLEGLGKAPAFFLVSYYILNLVPESYKDHDFFVSLFLFMLNTGQRYVTVCHIRLSDITSVVRRENKISIKFICRITKSNNDWNQPFVLEGTLEDTGIMNFVYWLNKFLVSEHGLHLQSFSTWDKKKSELKYLWGNKSDNFENKIAYMKVYKTWRYFYEQAGIPSKLLGTHSFRSGFYCQSLLNASLKGVDYNVMNELAALIAGWRKPEDRAHYNKNETRALITPAGVIKNPTPEQLMGCDTEFVSRW
jgi:hypothetical protein